MIINKIEDKKKVTTWKIGKDQRRQEIGLARDTQILGMKHNYHLTHGLRGDPSGNEKRICGKVVF